MFMHNKDKFKQKKKDFARRVAKMQEQGVPKAPSCYGILTHQFVKCI